MLLKQYINSVWPGWKNTTPLCIDIFDPCSYKHHIVWSSFEFQQKPDTVWNYQVKRKKSEPPCRDFFNLFIVTNWRLCISKLSLLNHVPSVPMCLMWLPALHGKVPYLPTCLPALFYLSCPYFFTDLCAYMLRYIFRAYVPWRLKSFGAYVCSFFMYLRA